MRCPSICSSCSSHYPFEPFELHPAVVDIFQQNCPALRRASLSGYWTKIGNGCCQTRDAGMLWSSKIGAAARLLAAGAGRGTHDPRGPVWEPPSHWWFTTLATTPSYTHMRLVYGPREALFVMDSAMTFFLVHWDVFVGDANIGLLRCVHW